jgi:Xaa-Pro aminopeptidase
MDYTDRVNRVRDAMARAGIDLLAVPPGDDLRWLTGFSPVADERACYLFLGGHDGLFLVPVLNAAQSEGHVRQPFVTYSDAAGPATALAGAGRQFASPRTIAVGDTMRADALLLLQRTWPEARYVAGGAVLAPLRMRKTSDEIAALRTAAATADAAVEAAIRACRPGVTELDVARAADEGFRQAGAPEVMATIVGSGPNSAFPHHHSGARPLRDGEPVLFDLGSRVDGYCSDITRMAFLGSPPTRYREIHGVVEDAITAAIEVIQPGIPASAVDLAARQTIERAGYGEQFVHRTGHGIGLSGHEPPSIAHTNELALEEGLAFSVEPGIYLAGEFGVRLEEIVVVTRTGAEVLSRLSRQVRVVG